MWDFLCGKYGENTGDFISQQFFLICSNLTIKFQLQALESFSRLSGDYNDFMGDIQRNRSFRETFCGVPGLENGDNVNDSNNGSNTGAPYRGAVGLLAAACGLSSETFLGGFDLNELSGSMPQLSHFFAVDVLDSISSGKNETSKSCFDLNYNTTNRKGTSKQILSGQSGFHMPQLWCSSSDLTR